LKEEDTIQEGQVKEILDFETQFDEIGGMVAAVMENLTKIKVLDPAV
jgi:hypothetical protein